MSSSEDDDEPVMGTGARGKLKQASIGPGALIGGKLRCEGFPNETMPAFFIDSDPHPTDITQSAAVKWILGARSRTREWAQFWLCLLLRVIYAHYRAHVKRAKKTEKRLSELQKQHNEIRDELEKSTAALLSAHAENKRLATDIEEEKWANGFILKSAHNSSERKLQQLQTELTYAQKEAAKRKAILRANHSAVESLRSQLESIHTQAEYHKQEIAMSSANIASMQAELADAQKKIKSYQQTLHLNRVNITQLRQQLLQSKEENERLAFDLSVRDAEVTLLMRQNGDDHLPKFSDGRLK